MSFKIENHKELTQVTTYQDTGLGIMRWGIDNSFPQTLKNLIKQSPSAGPAVARTAKFLKGSGFDGEDEVVNPQGLTLGQVVNIMADDFSPFEAFALHCNFNLEGKVTSIIPMRITDLRFNQFDELNYASKLGYHENFGRNSEVQKTVTSSVTRERIRWIDRFNPSAVLKQIENIGDSLPGITERTEIQKQIMGIGKYKGQILYHSEAGHSSYPIPPLQAAINYVLADVENSILVRKESSTGFINTFLLKTAMASDAKNLEALEDAIDLSQGARGTGRIITMSDMSEEEMKSTVLEEIGAGSSGRTSTIESATKAYELAQRVITGTYLIPPILAGSDQKTGFSSADLEEAYEVFNSITQGGRDVIEAELNKILENSVFKTRNISIKPLSLKAAEKEAQVEQVKEK